MKGKIEKFFTWLAAVAELLMPWQAKDATRFTKKARTPKLKRMWQHIADRMLASGKSEGAAIRAANGVIRRRSR